MNTYNKEELESMADLITDYISERECKENLIGNDYDCVNCENIEECHMEASIRCSSEWAESVDYGGYDSEDEFWENL
jgi:hypothetical protein